MMDAASVEARSVYEEISTCLFDWLYEHWVSLGYSDGMIKSLTENMGPNTYGKI